MMKTTMKKMMKMTTIMMKMMMNTSKKMMMILTTMFIMVMTIFSNNFLGFNLPQFFQTTLKERLTTKPPISLFLLSIPFMIMPKGAEKMYKKYYKKRCETRCLENTIIKYLSMPS
jgi:K+ transporter